MGSIAKSLSKRKVVGIDTPIFLYHLENHPQYVTLTKELLGGIERGKWNGITSVITLMEITVHPWKEGFENIARQYETLLINFPNLTVGVIDREVARLAAQMRANFGIRPPDAL
jgi:predicted nucleic acid-binding protein